MLILGLMYIIFEQSILQQVPDDTGLGSVKPGGVSRAILGVQVGKTASRPPQLPLTTSRSASSPSPS